MPGRLASSIALCQAHGEPITTPLGQTWLFPVPETVLALPDAEFARLGLAFKRRPLRAAAEACLEFGSKWAGLDPVTLVGKVQNVQRVGPWTAGATIADLTNNYALYPFTLPSAHGSNISDQSDLARNRARVRPRLGMLGWRPIHLPGESGRPNTDLLSLLL